MGEKSREELKQESYVRDERVFAGRVTKRMDELGLQAKDLADACEISITAIQAILKGKTKYPRPETLFDLADKLGLEPRWLGTYKGPRLVASTPERKVLIRSQDSRKPASPHRHIKTRTER